MDSQPQKQLKPVQKPPFVFIAKWRDVFLMVCVLIVGAVLSYANMRESKSDLAIVFILGSYFAISTWAAALNISALIKSEAARLMMSLLIGAVATTMAYFALIGLYLGTAHYFGINFKDSPTWQSELYFWSCYFAIGALIILFLQILPKWIALDD